MTHQDKPRHLLETACFSVPSSLDDTEHNLRVMEEAIAAAREKGVQFLVFGEAFLTGFEGLSFNYWADSMKALALDGPEISRIRGWAKEHSMARAAPCRLRIGTSSTLSKTFKTPAAPNSPVKRTFFCSSKAP